MTAPGRRPPDAATGHALCSTRAVPARRHAAALCAATLAALALAAHAEDEAVADWHETAVAAAAETPSGWSSGPVAEERPPAPADWQGGLSGPTGARHVGYGWTLRRGRSSITVSVGATEYRVPLDAEAPVAGTAPELLPSVQLGWYRRLSEHAGVYAATDALSRNDDGRVVSVRRARLGFEWSPFKGSRLGISHGGLRIKFDDQSRMLLKVRRSSFSAYWQAKF